MGTGDDLVVRSGSIMMAIWNLRSKFSGKTDWFQAAIALRDRVGGREIPKVEWLTEMRTSINNGATYFGCSYV